MPDPIIGYWDTETYCETPLRNGTAAYAEDAEIMLHQWAIGDGPVEVWDATDGGDAPDELVWMFQHADIIVIQNSFFDRTVARHAGIRINGRRVPLIILPERIHDTMVQALSHGLPGGLDRLCEIFKLPVDKAKDKRGKQLVQLFCKPRPANSKIRRATKHTHPVEWEIFVEEYAPSDVVSMREIYKKLPRWNYPAPREHALWCLDQKANDRGVKVDLDLARAAIDTVNVTKKGMDKRTAELTGEALRSTTQRDKLLKYVLEQHDVELPDMQATTLERRIEDPQLPWMVKELLAMRLQTSTTSNSKYNKLLKAVSSDGRLRGMLQFSGAARTKRWAGRVVQLQNLPRPDMEAWDIEIGIEAMKARGAHLLYDNPIKLASNALRGFIVADKGKKLVVSDLQGIEARVIAWLAGEEWKLQSFRDYDAGIGEDVHRQTAARMLHKRPDQVSDAERQSHGKHPEYACSYGGSKAALFAVALLFNYIIDEDEAMDLVRLWRSIHPKIADWDTGFWKQLDDAARQAIMAPERTFSAGEHIRFERWREWLKMELPSGGFLSYAAPAIVEDPRRPGSRSVSFMGINNYTKRWERIYTFGGKLAADATQSTAREIMAEAWPKIEEAGYRPLLTVHDEFITEPPDDPVYSVEGLNALLAANPPWAKGLPLAAGGFESYRYRKGE